VSSFTAAAIASSSFTRNSVRKKKTSRCGPRGFITVEGTMRMLIDPTNNRERFFDASSTTAKQEKVEKREVRIKDSRTFNLEMTFIISR
jgi:hypothetical protein